MRNSLITSSYDANRQRWKQVYNNGTSSETTVFIGGIMEKRVEGSYTEYRHYISAGGRSVALRTTHELGAAMVTEDRYFLTDHLGSVAEISNNAGAIDISESFAAFGQRRDPADWDGPITAGDETLIGDTTQRGFTFHTNMESSTLIHMNGRIADSLTGRFISADPYVPNPGSTQSFNRYSYVQNRPLSVTDPSGFFDFGFSAFWFVFSTAANYITGSGGHHGIARPPPTGCINDASTVGCYGKAIAKKVYNTVSDVIRDPFGLRRGRLGSGGFGDGRFGSGACGYVCLSVQDGDLSQTGATSEASFIFGLSGGELAHEGALIFWPGYDLGTCVSEGGCSGFEWAIGVVGIIPGGKVAALGGKSIAKALAKKADDVGGLVIGKLDDLKKGSGWRTGDHTLNLPPLPPGPGRWAQNARELQNAINKGSPIRDISPTKAGGFLDKERALLIENGWRFDPATSLWTPGK